MKKWLGLLVCCVALHGGGVAYAIEGLTGSTWGTVIQDFNGDGVLTLGNVTQGIDWFEVNGFRFTTFAKLQWRLRSQDGQTFNAYGPSLGVSVRKWSFGLGAEYIWQRQRVDSYDLDGRTQIFLDWYYDWDLLKLFK